MCVRKLFNLVPALEEVNGLLVGLTCGWFWFGFVATVGAVYRKDGPWMLCDGCHVG